MRYFSGLSKRILRLAPLSIVLALLAGIAQAQGGSDFINGELSISNPAVVNARDYKLRLKAITLSNVPSGSGSHTNSWLGIFLDNKGGTYGMKFTQVGLLTNYSGVRWFVYSEAGVTCLRGSTNWGTLGCWGDPGDWVAFGTWHWVELVKYPLDSFWIARVYNSAGTATDVAKINNSSNVIYRAQAVMEQAYGESQDPHYTGYFDFWHPQYMVWGTGFQEWPQSDNTNHNLLSALDLTGQNTFCPTYLGATPNLMGDERSWFAGTWGQTCQWLLFPSKHIYLPMITR